MPQTSAAGVKRFTKIHTQQMNENTFYTHTQTKSSQVKEQMHKVNKVHIKKERSLVQVLMIPQPGVQEFKHGCAL